MAALLEMRPEGLFCPAGGFFIDPRRKVAQAVVTHGHADHLRRGMGRLIATPETLAVADVRIGRGGYGEPQPLPYGRRLSLGAAEVTLIPAGHCLGSAQVVIETDEGRAVVTGDYKRDADPSCAPFAQPRCDLLVTEATFGLPVWRFPRPEAEIDRLLRSLARFPRRSHVVAAYSLGKAQRLIAELRRRGHAGVIHIHRALAGISAVYERFGVALGPLAPVEKGDAPLAGAVILAPPGGAGDAWIGRLVDPVTVSASGWNRGARRAAGCELPLVISDHCDWDGLTRTIAESGAREVWIDHGPAAALARWCAARGIAARAAA